jgi:hypothetical protein
MEMEKKNEGLNCKREKKRKKRRGKVVLEQK